LKHKDEGLIPSAGCSNFLRSPDYSNQNFDFPFSYQNSSIDLKISSFPFRSKYDFSDIKIEKQISIEKNKEILEKRNYEGMKEYLNECGMDKVRFREEMEKKHKLKNLINHYEKSFKEIQEENKSIGVNLDNLNLKKAICPSPIKHRLDNTLAISSNKKTFLEINSTGNFTLNAKRFINNNYKNSCAINEDSNLILKSKIRNSNKIFNNFDRLNFNNVRNYQISDSKNSIENEKFLNKNLFKQNLIKINIKFNEVEIIKRNSNIIPKIKQSLHKIHSDATIKTLNKVFDSQKNFSKLLQVNEIEAEDELKYLVNPLSFEGLNIFATSVSPTGILVPNGYPTGFDFTYKNSDNCENENFNFNSFATSKNNFLSQRRTVSFNNKGFLKDNNHLLTQKQKLRKSNFNFTHDAIKKAFLPPADDKKYPKYFLPQPGFGLLTRTNIKIEKKY
jgi:hypothetical protein